MSIETIYSQLIGAGLSPAGACAVMGNMQAESGMKANISQRGMTLLSDEDYTASADMGSIDFAHDAVGYGLCQWTYWTRKQSLLAFARLKGVSVGDEATQVSFCLDELKRDYSGLYKYLCSTKDLYEATERVCKEFERPAVNNVEDRYKFAQEFYRQFAGGTNVGNTTPRTESVELPIVNRGDYTAEALYMLELLRRRGYDVLWDGLWACLVDFQQKMGLKADGICGEKTWGKLLEE